MTLAIDAVSSTRFQFRCCGNSGCPRRFRSPNSVHASQKWVLGEAACLQRDAMSHPTFAMLVEYGYSLTRESYLNINNVDEDDHDRRRQRSHMPPTSRSRRRVR